MKFLYLILFLLILSCSHSKNEDYFRDLYLFLKVESISEIEYLVYSNTYKVDGKTKSLPKSIRIIIKQIAKNYSDEVDIFVIDYFDGKEKIFYKNIPCQDSAGKVACLCSETETALKGHAILTFSKKSITRNDTIVDNFLYSENEKTILELSQKPCYGQIIDSKKLLLIYANPSE